MPWTVANKGHLRVALVAGGYCGVYIVGVNKAHSGCGCMLIWQAELERLFDVWNNISANTN